MKRMILLCLVLVMFSGCGVYVNAEYSQLIDRNVATGDEMAARARDGALDPNEMTRGLEWNAAAWHKFQDAKNGKDGK